MNVVSFPNLMITVTLYYKFPLPNSLPYSIVLSCLVAFVVITHKYVA